MKRNLKKKVYLGVSERFNVIFCFFWFWYERFRGNIIITGVYDNGRVFDVLTPRGIKRVNKSDL